MNTLSEELDKLAEIKDTLAALVKECDELDIVEQMVEDKRASKALQNAYEGMCDLYNSYTMLTHIEEARRIGG